MGGASTFLILTCICNCFALRFLSPPELAAFGHIHSPAYQQLVPFTEPSYYNRNYTVTTTVDLFGCFPKGLPGQTPPRYDGKLVWIAFFYPCPDVPGSSGSGYPFLNLWKSYQDQGAAGIIGTDVAQQADTGTTTRMLGDPSTVNIPMIVMKYLKNIYTPYDPVTNPIVAFSLFTFPPNFSNITAFLETPDLSPLAFNNLYPYPANGWAFIRWTTVAMSLMVLLFALTKLSAFVFYEGGVRLSIPQMILGLCVASCFFEFLEWNFGPNACSWVWPYPVGAFFFSHYLPYWYSAVVLYCFYLIEVSMLTGNTISTIQRFKWPCVVLLAGLMVIELVVASIFAAFPSTLNFTTIFQLWSCIYIICAGSISLLLAFSTVLFARAIFSTDKTSMGIRIMVINATLFLLIWFSVVGFFCIVLNNWFYYPYWNLVFASLGFSTFLSCLVLCLSLRISVQKEIEISKSATSSTSAASNNSYGSSSSRSTSSSAAADPVIEL